MTLLAPSTLRRTTALGGALLSLLATPAAAQVALSHTDDAAPVRRGALRVRLTNAWTRWDQQYGASGLVPSGSELSADPLGVEQFPLLVPIEASLRELAGNPGTRLSLGRLVTRSDARIVTTPIAMEYGVTRRLSVGVIVPVVQTRRTLSVTVNSATGAPANVGIVGATERGAASAANNLASSSSNTASTQLAALIARCQGDPSGAGCGPVNADPSGAAAALARARQYAMAAASLGTTSATALVAPRATGTIALEIELRRNALNRQLQQFLGASAQQVSPVFFAPNDFAYGDLQGRAGVPGLLQGTIGGGLDSIRTTERVRFGDITIGAQYLVLDRFQRDAQPIPRIQSRLSVGAAVRLGTSVADTATNLVDLGTGDGPGAEVRGALDLIIGRVGGTIATRYLRSFAREVSAPLLGDPEAPFPLPLLGRRQRTAGDVLGIDVTPRYLLSDVLSLDAHYGIERTGAVTYGLAEGVTPPAFCAFTSCDPVPGTARTAQRVGAGFRYSTVNAHAQGRARYPFEVSYLHLTTTSGDAGVPKLSREQIQVRLFYQLFWR